ncbi:hypothetical protein [Providencia burhodogranariea]|uniref:Fimbrial protein n=1 Tax=Providencia burhodogranariea DSM 19968 TaxID=1141662 RepID=K8X0K9_9GAMM|nr:hypothetical protein [Providencia burhodogranariea]EKT61995.1 hypothetical protein OOA_08891 [Providencia burhodogranariea DSM 19968]
MKYLMLKTIILSTILFLSFPSLSASIIPDSVGTYNSCELIDNGDGTSTATVNVTYQYYTHPEPMLSRAVFLQFYDKYGEYSPKKISDSAISLGGTTASSTTGIGMSALYAGNSGDWKGIKGRTTDFSILVPNSYLEEWQGMALGVADRNIAGNFYLEESGVAYLLYDGDGTCRVIPPEKPPEPPKNIKFKFSLPQLWDLKEIPPGISDVSFSGVRSEEFCIKYDNKQTSDTQFLMTVNSVNEKENDFNLINNLRPGDTIKYKLLLSDGVNNLLFPSNSGNSYIFNKNDQEVCFFPTFKIDAGSNPKEGQYSDMLNFNIIVNP